MTDILKRYIPIAFEREEERSGWLYHGEEKDI